MSRSAAMRATACASSNHVYDEEQKRRDWIAAQWRLCPYKIAFEGRGDCVVLDGYLRPIVRIFADERTEILSPDAEFCADYGIEPIYIEAFFPDHLVSIELVFPLGKGARDTISGYIEKYGLAPELQRRRELLRRGELSYGEGW